MHRSSGDSRRGALELGGEPADRPEGRFERDDVGERGAIEQRLGAVEQRRQQRGHGDCVAVGDTEPDRRRNRRRRRTRPPHRGAGSCRDRRPSMSKHGPASRSGVVQMTVDGVALGSPTAEDGGQLGADGEGRRRCHRRSSGGELEPAARCGRVTVATIVPTHGIGALGKPRARRDGARAVSLGYHVTPVMLGARPACSILLAQGFWTTPRVGRAQLFKSLSPRSRSRCTDDALITRGRRTDSDLWRAGFELDPVVRVDRRPRATQRLPAEAGPCHCSHGSRR